MTDWDCIYCKSQPDDPSPCECSHSPCIHDRNAQLAEMKKFLLYEKERALGFRSLCYERNDKIAELEKELQHAQTQEGLRGALCALPFTEAREITGEWIDYEYYDHWLEQLEEAKRLLLEAKSLLHVMAPPSGAWSERVEQLIRKRTP